MKSCKMHPASFSQPLVVAAFVMLIFLASFAQSQTTTLPPAKPKRPATPAEKTPQRTAAKAIGELPPPEPAGETAPLTPTPNPFPTKGLGLPLAPNNDAPAKGLPAANNVGEEGNQPGYFGAITDDRQKLPGVRIVELVAGGPAELAGLREGDLITSVNEQPVREMADLAQVFTASKAGQQLKITYQRGATLNTPGRDASLIVTLGERPPEQARRFTQFGRIEEDAILQPDGDRPTGMILGVRAAPLDVANQRRLGVPIQEGALVLEVTPGSPAGLAGIPRDAVIVSLNGLLVESPDALTREILKAGPGAEIELGYYMGRTPVKRRLVLGGGPITGEVRNGLPAGGAPSGVNRLNDAAAARIGQLEQQVQELQRRIELLEQHLQK
jgi:membrane-associated protease RseP (regulator of RpoE activity)